MPEEYRSRRSCLAVPGSSQRFLDKARGLAADEVFLDLEDAVAPAAREAARRNVIAALNDGGWGGKLVAVRVNDATTRWAYRDVAEVVAAARWISRAPPTWRGSWPARWSGIAGRRRPGGSTGHRRRRHRPRAARR